MRGQPPRHQKESNEAGPDQPMRAQRPTIQEINEAGPEPPMSAPSATIQEITEVSPACERKEPEEAADSRASSSEGASRLTIARRAHLAKLTHQTVYES